MGNASTIGHKQKEPYVHEIVGLVMKDESSLQSNINEFTVGYIGLGGISALCANYGRKSLFGESPLNNIQNKQARFLKLGGIVGMCIFGNLIGNDVYQRKVNYEQACQMANMIKPLLVTDSNDYKVIYRNPEQGTLLFHDNKFVFRKVSQHIPLKENLYTNRLLNMISHNNVVYGHCIPRNKRLLLTTQPINDMVKLEENNTKCSPIAYLNASNSYFTGLIPGRLQNSLVGSTNELISEPKSEPKSELISEPKYEPASEPKSEPKSEPASELISEPTSATELISEPKLVQISADTINKIDTVKDEHINSKQLYYGMYSRPILKDGSTKIDGSVSLGGDIIIIDGENSLYLTELVAKFFYRCNKLFPEEPQVVLDNIQYAIVHYMFPLDSYNYKDNCDISIDQMILNGNGVCRHHMILYGYLIEKAIKYRFLKGTFKCRRMHSDFILEPNHVWIEYTDISGEVYIIDGNNFVIKNIKEIGLTNEEEKNMKEKYYSK